MNVLCVCVCVCVVGKTSVWYQGPVTLNICICNTENVKMKSLMCWSCAYVIYLLV